MSDWTVEVPPELLRSLAESFAAGPIVDDEGRVQIEKRRVDRIDGLTVEIYSDEHGPPHFHVAYGGEGNAFSIEDCQPLHGDGLRAYFRNIRKWHAENKPRLIETWNRCRPADCPVGAYCE